MEINRVLDRSPVPDLDAYVGSGGGEALALAGRSDPGAVISAIRDAGLRGRGGAGFPTATKWATVAASESASDETVVVVNAAEGEPGTFKDHVLLRRNPYRVLEGALVAARVVGAGSVKVGIKASFAPEIERLQAAITEISDAGLSDGTEISLVLGPSSYLFGEETALLEVVEGRQPFPRVAPPFRRGVDSRSPHRSAADNELAAEGGSGVAPVLVDNVETLANVPQIVLNGPDWFRELGTERSPGTIVCTVSGDTKRAGVGEFPMGTPLSEVIASLGGGPRRGRSIRTVAPGASSELIPGDALDVALTYEAMQDAGSGLGSAGFIVFDDSRSPLEVAQGISRFLSVESCGQCEPCKAEGLAITADLESLRSSVGEETASAQGGREQVLARLGERASRVTDGARCNLAFQQQEVVASLLARFDAPALAPAPTGDGGGVPLVAPITDIVDGRARLEQDQADKQPDWTVGGADSGSYPAERLVDTPVEVL